MGERGGDPQSSCSWLCKRGGGVRALARAHIRGHQRASEVITAGHQKASEGIGRNQKESARAQQAMNRPLEMNWNPLKRSTNLHASEERHQHAMRGAISMQ